VNEGLASFAVAGRYEGTLVVEAVPAHALVGIVGRVGRARACKDASYLLLLVVSR
jgi:hypothetical protein